MLLRMALYWGRRGDAIYEMTSVHAAITGLSIDIKMLVNGVILDELSIKVYR